jgi:hypothetical protein
MEQTKKRRRKKINITKILQNIYSCVTIVENILTFAKKIIKYNHNMIVMRKNAQKM